MLSQTPTFPDKQPYQMPRPYPCPDNCYSNREFML